MQWINYVSTATCCGKPALEDGPRIMATISGTTMEIEPFATVTVVDGSVAEMPQLDLPRWLEKGCGKHFISASTIKGGYYVL
jgi:hypothetical protein